MREGRGGGERGGEEGGAGLEGEGARRRETPGQGGRKERCSRRRSRTWWGEVGRVVDLALPVSAHSSVMLAMRAPWWLRW